jgi:hypothetical protein
MDGRLWKRLYREISRACKHRVGPRRPGRPQVYQTKEILSVWAFAALNDWPISVTRKRLTSSATGWWMRRHWRWPLRLPSLPTLTRRARDGMFRRLLRRVLRRLRKRLAGIPTGLMVMDSTFLLTGPYSRDPESRWTSHGGKWFKGYALHALCDTEGVLWAWHVTSANVHELTVARRLIRQASLAGGQVLWVIADKGYDSEPLHQLVRRRLGGQLLAPLNLRGAKTDRWRKKQHGRDTADRVLRTRQGQRLMAHRSSIERWNSWFKGHSNVGMLPYHARRLRRVRRWIDLKLMVFFTHQYLLRNDLSAVA